MASTLDWKAQYDDDDSVIYLLDAETRCGVREGDRRCIMDVVPPALRDFYLAAYSNVQRRRGTGGIFSSAISETPLETAAPKPVRDYASVDRIVTMCSHCRRVQRIRQPATWDWVPELLLSGQVMATFGLCEFCTAYHYSLH